MPKKNYSHGFTLVELLVVIAMLSVLTSFLLIYLNPFKQIDKAKDVTRESNLAQISSALDNYYNDHNCYPTSLSFGSSLQQGSSIYMKKIPQDPDCSGGGSCYQYVPDPSACPQWKVLFAKVINKSASSVSCALERLPNCLPSNYYNAGYGYCAVSGKVDCTDMISIPIPLSGGPQSVPTPTP